MTEADAGDRALEAYYGDMGFYACGAEDVPCVLACNCR